MAYKAKNGVTPSDRPFAIARVPYFNVASIIAKLIHPQPSHLARNLAQALEQHPEPLRQCDLTLVRHRVHRLPLRTLRRVELRLLF